MWNVDASDYFKDVAKVIKKTAKGKTIIYVALLRPYDQVAAVLKKAGIKTDSLFFIDCTSGTDGRREEKKNVIFVNGQQDLTGIGIAVSQALKNIEGKKLVLMGSISTLFLYNDTGLVQRFLNFFVNKLRQEDIDGILVTTKDDPNKDAIGVIKTFCDEVKEI